MLWSGCSIRQQSISLGLQIYLWKGVRTGREYSTAVGPVPRGEVGEGGDGAASSVTEVAIKVCFEIHHCAFVSMIEREE